jgi:hypothetical protein
VFEGYADALGYGSQRRRNLTAEGRYILSPPQFKEAAFDANY